MTRIFRLILEEIEGHIGRGRRSSKTSNHKFQCSRNNKYTVERIYHGEESPNNVILVDNGNNDCMTVKIFYIRK